MTAWQARAGRPSSCELIASPATILDGYTGRQLAGPALAAALEPVRQAYDRLPAGLVLARTDRTVESVLRYLAAVAGERPVALLDPALTRRQLDDLMTRFEPAAVVGLAERPVLDGPPGHAAYRADEIDGLGGVWWRTASAARLPHPELSVLLATSGSTGEPKLVRLSRRGLLANAMAIGQALRLDGRETAPTSLPLFYSYGLSVLNSHLAVGGTVVLTGGGVYSREFWRVCAAHRVTSFAGVPHQFELLARMGWTPASSPGLRTLTQAGGRLCSELVRRFHQLACDHRADLVLMYGQTEATARISVLPPARLVDKPGSVGLAVPGSSLHIRLDSGRFADTPGQTGEVVVRGPGVMLGYASGAADLSRGDDLGGELATGDLGHLDDERFLYLTGRRRRIGKVFGVRVNLDEVERIAGDGTGPLAAVAADDRIVVWCAGLTADAAARVAAQLAGRLRLHRYGIEGRGVDRLPTLPNGKVDYARLTAEALG